jgi:manganese/iron transport system substrate-binding protein
MLRIFMRLRLTRGSRRSLVVGGIAVALLAGACGSETAAGSATPTPNPGAVPVVATTTVFADLVAQVGGPRVRASSLVPKGGEVHTFDPDPSDIQNVADAKLIVRNGLGLDDWLESLVRDAGTDAPVVVLGENLNGVSYVEGDNGSVNPHLWMDVAYTERYVDRIADALANVDPAGAEEYRRRAADYNTTLAKLDASIRDRLAAIPPADRTVVSFHDAFPYFAAAYGLTIAGNIVNAPGQDPSAGQVAALVDSIRSSGVSAIFAEAQFNDALAVTISDETGVQVVTDLYDGTLGDPPADSYVGMMTWDADRIVSAITGS